jgi:hypothetical protein
MNNPLDVKENNEHALDFALPFRSAPNGAFHSNSRVTAPAFFLERVSNHSQDLRRAFPQIFTKFDAVPLSDPSRNRSGQIIIII